MHHLHYQKLPESFRNRLQTLMLFIHTTTDGNNHVIIFFPESIKNLAKNLFAF